MSKPTTSTSLGLYMGYRPTHAARSAARQYVEQLHNRATVDVSTLASILEPGMMPVDPWRGRSARDAAWAAVEGILWDAAARGLVRRVPRVRQPWTHIWERTR